jgi:hypothetical protein
MRLDPLGQSKGEQPNKTQELKGAFARTEIQAQQGKGADDEGQFDFERRPLGE